MVESVEKIENEVSVSVESSESNTQHFILLIDLDTGSKAA